MPRLLFLAVSALALVAWPAAGDQLAVSVEANAIFDSNSQTGGGGRGESDYQFNASPRFTLRSDPGTSKLNYQASYEPVYQYFVKDRANRGFEHLLDGSVSYALTKRTTVSASGRYSQTLQILRRRASDLELSLPDTPEEPVRQTENTEQWNLSTNLNHSFNSRWRGSLSLGLGARDFPSPQQADSEFWQANGSVNYVQSSRSTIGLGIAVSEQERKSTPDLSGTRTRSYNLFGVWTYRFNPNLTLTAQAGPALIDPEDLEDAPDQLFFQRVVPFSLDFNGDVFVFDATTCPVEDGLTFFGSQCELFSDPVSASTADVLQRFNPATVNPVVALAASRFPGFIDLEDLDNSQTAALFGSAVPDRQQSTTTYFADVALIQRWKRASATFRYLRSDSGSLGGGTTTILDRLLFQLRWQPRERWSIRFNGSWTSRRSAVEDSPQLVTLVRPTTPTMTGVFAFDPDECFPPGEDFCSIPIPFMAALLPRGTLVSTGEFGFIEIDSATKVTTYSVATAVNYEFNERLLGRLRIGYRKQESDSTFATVRDFDGYIVQIGLRYSFEPIRF